MEAYMIALMSIMTFFSGLVIGAILMAVGHSEIYDRFLMNLTKRADLRMFESAFYYSNIGFFLVDLDGTFLKANTKACEMLGYTETELISKRFQEITHPDDLEKDLVQYNRMLTGEIRTYTITKRYITKSGSFFNAILTVSAVYDSSGELHIFISQVQENREQDV